MRPTRIGWYGDDFTGATDTLATVASAGLQAMLFLGVPSAEQLDAAGPLDALGIAGAARTMAPDAMAAALAPVGTFFAALGVAVLHYKCCSTFDSAPGIGSIGAAVACLRRYMPNTLVPILGGQPNIGRYCLFSTLFAAAGLGGAVHRLDRHPTMAHHPVTPMQEADLRRHLAAQGLADIGAVHFPVYQQGLAALQAQVAGLLAAQPEAALLFDVTPAGGIAAAGHAAVGARQRSAAAGGGGQQCDAGAGGRPAGEGAPAPVAGAGAGLRLRRQPVPGEPGAGGGGGGVRAFRDGAGPPAPLLAAVLAALQAGQSVMVQTGMVQTGAPDGAGSMAEATAGFIRDVVAASGVTRIGIAGGDTSSAAALGLGIWGLEYDRTLEPGVTLCRTRSQVQRLDGLELMLKGGQMGSAGLFQRLLTGD